MSRSNHRLQAGIPATKDGDIECLRHLLVDIDPVRPSNTNSSDQEHASALKKADEIMDSLTKKGWPDPILMDTGNGSCLVYRLPDLPNDQVSRATVATFLKALGCQFNSERIKVDSTVSNPSRLIRVPGTLNRKGDSTADRPQRRAAIISCPQTVGQVSLDQLHIFAFSFKEESASTPVSRDSGMQDRNHF